MVKETLSSGTEWKIWDLHVHTPASMVQSYGGNNDETWEKFITDLENLPPSFGVIGINDYWFLDGYKRVLEERKKGRLQNLLEIFPVIEMRFSHFGGTKNQLSRVNGHVIFDPELNPETIEAQFVSALSKSLKLSPNHSDLPWRGVITKDSLTDLGREIKQSVPVTELKNYKSDLEVGFNNLNVSFDDVCEILEGSYFKGKALIGLGKTEWADIKWKNQSIAEKKNLINTASLIFTAYSDQSIWESDIKKLQEQNLNHRLLDCSDAHHFSSSDNNMKIGSCQTWMNTSPTFAGLSYALEEFDRRVYVGLEPPTLARVHRQPQHFISQVTVDSPSGEEELFNYQIPLNPGFVAVVGNKGQGKSALLDCIALAGNSSRQHEFAFLNKKRFLSASGAKTAKKFRSEIEWRSGQKRTVNLTDSQDKATPVYVEYLPQAFVERVCNADPLSGETDEFERELRDVLFTHIKKEDRSQQSTFDELFAQKTQIPEAQINQLRLELKKVIAAYLNVASFRAHNVVDEVQNKIELKRGEIEAASQDLKAEKEALEKLDKENEDEQELVLLRETSEVNEKLQKEKLAQKSENESQQAQLSQKISRVRTIRDRARAIQVEVNQLDNETKSSTGFFDTAFITLDINEEEYITWTTGAEATLGLLQDTQDILSTELDEIEKKLEDTTKALSAADSARELARQRILHSQDRIDELNGSTDDPESLKGLVDLLSQLQKAPEEMNDYRDQILNISQSIHEALTEKLGVIESLYAPATSFIKESEVLINAGLDFYAELRVLPVWNQLSSRLDKRKNLDFVEWLDQVPLDIEDTSWAQISPKLRTTFDRLEREKGDLEKGGFRNPPEALRINERIEDFLLTLLGLEWLEVRVGLTGEGAPLTTLSPGQRGLILNLFYLVVDRRTTPLLLDQPEENLDNETIASKLVPAIHEAAGRRQTIVVTHNANLAVVGDADQIIHCKYRGNKFTVESGSIAEIDVARFALNVLEGTKQAFDNRRYKYEAFPNL